MSPWGAFLNAEFILSKPHACPPTANAGLCRK
jgi:hypothetical protein